MVGRDLGSDIFLALLLPWNSLETLHVYRKSHKKVKSGHNISRIFSILMLLDLTSRIEMAIEMAPITQLSLGDVIATIERIPGEVVMLVSIALSVCLVNLLNR